jgi:predicted MFS family arabinose efflux permease
MIMNKRILFAVSTAVVFVCISTVLLINVNRITLTPRDSSDAFDNIFFASGNSRRIAVIENAQESILVLDLSGQLIYRLDARPGSPASFTLAKMVQLDRENNLYILDANFGGAFEENTERIIKYSPEGKFEAEIFSYTYTNTGFHLDKGRITGMAYFDDAVYFIKLDEADFQLQRVRAGSPGAAVERLGIFEYPHAIRDLMYFSINPGQRIFSFSTKSGIIKQYDFSGASVYEWRDQEDGIHCFWNVVTDNNNNILYTDLITGEVGFIDTATGRRTSLFTLPERIAFYSFTLDYSGGMAFATTLGNVFIKDGDGPFEELEFYTYPSDMIAFNTVLFVLLIFDGLLLLALLVLLIKLISNCRFSQNAKKIISVGLCVAVGAVICSVLIINELGELYRQNILNDLQNISKIMAASIDIDPLVSMTSSAQYDDEEFLKLKDRVRFLFEQANFTGQKIYQLLIMEHNGILYSMNDIENFWPPFYPYSPWEEEDTIQSVYETKEFKNTEEITLTGSWLHTTGPLFDKDGNVAAFVETGVEMVSFQRELTRIVVQTVLIVIAATIAILLAIIELIVIFSAYKQNKLERLRQQPLSYSLPNLQRIISFLNGIYYKITTNPAEDVALDQPLFNRVINSLKKTYNRDLRQSLATSETAFHPELLRAVVFLQYFICNLECAILPIYSLKLYQPLFNLPRELVVTLPMTTEVIFTALALAIVPVIIGKVGFKQISLVSTLLLVAGNILCFLALNTAYLALGHALTGFSTGAIILVLNTIIGAQKTEEEINSGFAHFNVSLLAGVNVGLILGSTFAQFFPYRIVYVLATAAAVLQTAVIIYSVRSKLVSHIYNVNYTRTKEKTERFVLVKFFFRPVVLATLFLLQMPYLISMFFIYYFIPIFATDNGLTESNVGQLMLLNGLFAILFGTALCKWAADRFTPKFISLAVILLNVAAFYIFSFNPGIPMLIAATVLFAIVNIFSQTNIQTYYTSLYRDMPNIPPMKAMSIYSAVDNISAGLGPIVFSYILANSIGFYTKIFATAELGCLLVFIILSSVFAGKTAKRTSRDDHSRS